MREILLVEDSNEDAAVVQRALDTLSIANPVRRFVNGEEAMAYLDNIAEIAAIGPPPASILFLDLVLPKIRGLQILENIANQAAFAQTLRIVLTHLSDIDTIKRAYSLGAQSFLVKPVQIPDLLELIRAYPGYWSFDMQPLAQNRSDSNPKQSSAGRLATSSQPGPGGDPPDQ